MNRLNSVLLAIFVALTGVVLVVEKPFAGNPYERARERERPLFPGFDGARAAKLEIRSREKGVVVERAPDGTWVVPAALGYRAKMQGEDSVPGFFERILRLKVREPVSDRPENRDRFSVGEQGTLVRVSDEKGEALAEFVQGRFDINTSDPDFETKFNLATFVRRSDSSEVYLVGQFLPMGMKPTDWIDTSFVRFEPTATTEFTIEGDADLVGPRVHVVKQGDAWTIAGPEGGPAKKEAVDAWIAAIAYSVFRDVAGKGDDPSKFNLDKPLLVVRAKTSDGKEHSARFAKGPDGKTYYGSKGEGDPWVFVMDDWTVEKNLLKKLDDFREPPASQPASAPASAPSEPPATRPR
ncbi:MAG TPA: DUF4340 domain-containing protein [Planctomycetota bacterium]|nr:DUF4340 domain-containing protein [Planctomycetota bacterium]